MSIVAPIPSGLRCVAGIFLLVFAGWTLARVRPGEVGAGDYRISPWTRAEEQRMSEADLEFEALVEAVTEYLDGDGAITEG